MRLTEITNKNDSKNFLALVTFVASLGGILFGIDTAVVSGIFSIVEKYFMLDKIGVGWFASSALVGAIAGAFIAGALSDRFGRKPILIAAAILFFASAFGSAFPPTFTLLIIARLIGGVSVDITSVLAPLYISEFSPPGIRTKYIFR